MPRIKGIGGPHRFFFTSFDRNEPPHVHVERENKTCKFWLEPLGLARNHGFSARESRAYPNISRGCDRPRSKEDEEPEAGDATQRIADGGRQSIPTLIGPSLRVAAAGGRLRRHASSSYAVRYTISSAFLASALLTLATHLTRDIRIGSKCDSANHSDPSHRNFGGMV